MGIALERVPVVVFLQQSLGSVVWLMIHRIDLRGKSKMSRPRIRCYRFWLAILSVLVAFTLIAASSTVRAQENTVLSKEVATVTSFVGEVLVRNRMVWARVEKVGHPLFTGDKVVTKRGRAEVTFADGSLLRLGMDSNIQIAEKEQVKGLVFRRRWIKRTIRVALGKLYFSIRPTPGKGTLIQTPTMVAGLRGTAGFVDVRPDTSSFWSLTEGDAVVDGFYAALERFEVPDVSVPVGTLPPSDPAYAGTDIMRAVDKALTSQLEAGLAGLEGERLGQAASEKEGAANRNPTPASKLAAAKSRRAANEAELQGIAARCQAKKDAMSEAVVEADTMNDPISAEQARKYLERIEDAQARVEQTAARLGAMADQVLLSEDDIELADASTRLGNAAVNVAGSIAVVVDGLAKAGNMEARGDSSGARDALKFVEAGQRLAELAGALLEEGEAALLQQSALGKEEVSVRERGRVTEMLSAIENTTKTVLQSTKIQDLGAIDGVALEPVVALAGLTNLRAETALKSGKMALKAGKAGDDVALSEALGITGEMAEQTESIGKGVAGGDGMGGAVQVSDALLGAARGESTGATGASPGGGVGAGEEGADVLGITSSERENIQDFLVNEIVETAAVLDITMEEAAKLVLPEEVAEKVPNIISPAAP